MSLFSVRDTVNEQTGAQIWATEGGDVFINAASLKLFKERLINLEQNKHYHFVTGGQWCLHELIGFLLGVIGSSNMWLSTWAITEDPARALLDWKASGLIRELHGIFDYKIRDQKSEAFLLCESFFTKIHLTKCHAKVVVLQNETWEISVVTSANFTRNPRVERGVISTNKLSAQSDIEWMRGLMLNERYFSVRNAKS